MKNALIFLFLFIFSIDAKADKVNYKFEQITPLSGISFTGITTIQEDKNGFIWAGGETGLFFYDGISFKHYEQEYESHLLSSQVLEITKDSKDMLWVCTANGLAYFDSVKDCFRSVKDFTGKWVDGLLELSLNHYLVLADKILYKYDAQNNTICPLNNQPKKISSMCLFSADSIVAGTETGELYTIFLQDDKKHRLLFKEQHDKITTICRDDEWLYAGYNNSGINVVNTYGNKINSYSTTQVADKSRLPNNKIRKIVRRENGEIWIATYDGLGVLIAGKLTTFNNVNSNIHSSSIYDIYIDSHDCIWVGTWSGGISRYSPFVYQFGGESYYLVSNKIRFGVVTSFVSSSLTNSIWIGTENNGLYLYDYQNESFVKRFFPLSIHVKAMIRQDNKILLGAVEGVYQLNEHTGAITKFHIKSFTDKHPIISSMVIKNEVLYIATRSNGIVEYNLESGREKLYCFENKKLPINAVWQVFVDNHNNVYACTNKGFVVKKSIQDTFTSIAVPDAKNVLFYSIAPFSNGKLLLGTRNKGIYVYHIGSGDMELFCDKKKISGSEVYSLTVDPNDDIWASTNMGIIKLESDGLTINKYTESDGIIGQQFHPIASFLNTDGTLFWGSTIGFNYININHIEHNMTKPDVMPVGIKVNNKDLFADFGVRVNSRHIPDIRNMELPYYLNTLSFQLATNNLINPVKNTIKYKLEGYQEEWTTILQTDNIMFTQIPPGKYTLCALGANNDMLWGDQELRIAIHILPPFYATGWAYLMYIITACVILFIVYKNVKFRINALQQISSERNQNRVNKAITEERTKFFMNISHELRTPLNLIVAPMKILCQKHFDKETSFHLDVVYRNTERLRHLTEQILDFRLLEINKIKTTKKNVDIVPLCKNIISEFNYYVKKKNVSLNLFSDAHVRYVYCDASMIEKMIYNLLFNALKYTVSEPQININIRKTKLTEEDFHHVFFVGNKFYGTAIQIEVSDNGDGISRDRFEAIFERFTTYHNEEQSGSGIGLHLCKEYVILHDGLIMLISHEGKGSKFIVCLPLQAHEDTTDVSIPVIFSPKTKECLAYDNDTDDDEYKGRLQQSVKTVLLVDDNEEVIYYLKKSLSYMYKCLVAKNGKIGYDMAVSIMPDIVVMDYMMPVMNGIECTKAIRSNDKIKNLPVIMLTGAADSESHKKAVNAGADVFLVKPVDEELLIEHIHKLLDKANKIKETSVNEKIPPAFIDRLDFYLEKNITDPDFDVEALADCMHASRSSLFRKIKAETGYNISEYIKEKRLNVAVELIRKGQVNVEELSTCCGFNSSSYFCKCFKNKFGMPPREYIKRNSGNDS